MPCDRIYTISVNLEVANRELLVNALEALGWRAEILSASGTIRFRSPTDGRGSILADGTITGAAAFVARVAPQIKQAYSAQAVAKAAQQFQWRVRQTSASQITLERRA